MPAVERLRLAVKKDGALQFLSHLDFARAVRYVIIRARLPIAYSEGFNPHMKLSFASALGVGVTADEEYLDMELRERLPVEDVVEQMNAQSPDALSSWAANTSMPEHLSSWQWQLRRVLPDRSHTGRIRDDALQQALQAFNDASDVMYEKVSPKDARKVRLINVKHHVVEPLSGKTDGKTLTLRIGILQTDEGAIKPQQVWEVLGKQFGIPLDADMMLARRIGIYHRRGRKTSPSLKRYNLMKKSVLPAAPICCGKALFAFACISMSVAVYFA